MIAEQFIRELTDEAQKTRRTLERIPGAELTWAPHPKSLTIGQLGWHLAVLPRAIADLLSELERDAPNVPRPQPGSVQEILAAFDESIPYAAKRITEWGDEGLQQIWTLKFQGAHGLPDPARGGGPRDPSQSHVPPPRPAHRLSAPARCPGAVDLRPVGG